MNKKLELTNKEIYLLKQLIEEYERLRKNGEVW